MSNEKVIADLVKLGQLNNEMKRLALNIKNLKLQKEETEREITQFLIDANQPGIQYNNLIVLNKNYKQTKSKNKEDRNQSMIEVLENNGVRNSEEVLKQLLNSTKDTIEKNKLQIKEIKFS